jgi:hypothetical protein
MAKWSIEKVREAWEANGKDFEKTQTALGISRASLFRFLKEIRQSGSPSSPSNRGKQAAKGAGKSWNLYLPADLDWIRVRLESYAKAQRRSVSEVVMFILEAHLKAQEQKLPRPPERPAWLDEEIPGGEK